MIILGLDPGSVRIGYGLIDARGQKISYLASGILKTGDLERGNRLLSLENHLQQIIKKFWPETAAIEKLFFAQNQKTALSVAETRGVLMNLLYKNKLRILEMTPSEVKLAVAGYGRADKKAVAKMVLSVLRLPQQKIIDDASDALAIAIAASGRRPQAGS